MMDAIDERIFLSTPTMLDMVGAYLECMEWADSCQHCGDDPDQDCNECDNWSPAIEHSPNAEQDCLNFWRSIPDDLQLRGDMEQLGHDFWLTRCGHGVGFWARPEIWGEKEAKILTELSERMEIV